MTIFIIFLGGDLGTVKLVLGLGVFFIGDFANHSVTYQGNQRDISPLEIWILEIDMDDCHIPPISRLP
ncbi:MAG: hypothetical protein ABI970_00270 [Chloroflexota bacterium]|nr:hypothetical protein [Anaerolineae bacterium]